MDYTEIFDSIQSLDEAFDFISSSTKSFMKQKRNQYKTNGHKKYIAYGKIIGTYKDNFLVFMTADSEYLMIKVNGDVKEYPIEYVLRAKGLTYILNKNSNFKIYLNQFQENRVGNIDNFPTFLMDSISPLLEVELLKLDNAK